MLKQFLKILSIFLIGFLGGALSHQIFLSFFLKTQPQPIQVIERREVKIQENVALQEAIEKAQKRVIFLQTKTKTISGCGFILTSDGLAITLNQLIPAGSQTEIFFDGSKIPFQVLKRDQKENLVLLKLEGKNFPTLPFGDLENISIGERVFLVCSFSEREKIQNFANEGLIKTFNEETIITNIIEEEKALGSPLFDIEGKFLGLSQLDKTGKIIVVPISKIRSFANL